MDTSTSRKLSTMNNLAVVIPREGRKVGTVEDFYFKEGSNAIYSLLISTRLYGPYSLPVSALRTFEDDKVTIDNANMLIKGLPPLLRTKSLLGYRVVDEESKALGSVGEVWISTTPVVAPHIAAIELLPPKGSRTARGKSFTADAIVGYEDEYLIIQDQVARRLR